MTHGSNRTTRQPLKTGWEVDAIEHKNDLASNHKPRVRSFIKRVIRRRARRTMLAWESEEA